MIMTAAADTSGAQLFPLFGWEFFSVFFFSGHVSIFFFIWARRMDMVSGEIWKMYRVPLISVNNKSALSPALLHPPLREMAV